MGEYNGFKEHFRIWMTSGTPNLLAGGNRNYLFILNEGGPSIRVGNVTGTALGIQGLLLVSGAHVEDVFSDDDWWGIALAGGSGSVSGYVVKQY